MKKHSSAIYKVGKFGYIFLILIPFGVLIISQGINVMRNFKLYQDEGKSEIRSERQQLLDERAETQRLLEELRAMQEQLRQQSPLTPTDNQAPAIAQTNNEATQIDTTTSDFEIQTGESLQPSALPKTDCENEENSE